MDTVVHPFQPKYGVDKNRYSPNIRRYSMLSDEYDLDKEDIMGDYNRSKNSRSDQEDKSKENESEHLLNTLNKSTNGDGKNSRKHRSTRKRNRSDMSPEELRKLRERERKAQQSRRDRIRAQKRQNQQWQDEDAAWEAFLDQTDCKKTTNQDKSAMPSMVCSVDENQDSKLKGKFEKQNSLESTTGSSHSTTYLSDDSSHSLYKEDPQKNKEAEEEMTRIPEEPSPRHHEEKIQPPPRHVDDEKKPRRNGDEKKTHRHNNYHHLPSPPAHPYRVYHQKLSPHSFHPSDLYPKMYHHESPIHHHPHPPTPPAYSPTEHKHFLAIQHHHHDKKHDAHHHRYPSHFMPVARSPQHSPSSNHHRENKQQHSVSPQHEKKKVISRNVDRKKLSEEELEELRRRERDYQRERRARIRMEKAKTQAQQERFNACRYTPHAEMYRHHLHHNRPQSDTISRYDHAEHYRISPGPNPTPEEHSTALEVKIPDCEKVNRQPKVEADLLQVVPKTRDCEDKHIPPTGTSSPVEEYPTIKAPKKSLLESICSTLKKESSEWDKEDTGNLIIDLKRDDDDKNRSPKMEPIDDDDDELDDRHLDGRSLTDEMKDEFHTKEYDDSKLSQAEDQKLRDKLTEEQLERRRKSNREAQRRRRARLKMQGHLEERHDFEQHDEILDKEDRSEYKHCKSRPDSLYMPPYEGFPAHRGSPYHKEPRSGHHESVHYIHDKYASPHIMVDPHHHHGSSKHPAYYHPPHHRVSEMEDSQRHHPHYYYDSPDYRHHLPHRSHDNHHRRHETLGEREREYTRSRSPHAPHSHNNSRSTSKSATPPHSRKAPSPPPLTSDHHQSQQHSSRRESESKDDSISTSNEINDSTASKSSGRKRKQFAPRKLASTSVNTTPDEDVVGESLPVNENREQPFDEENKVVILPNGNEDEEDEQS